MPEDEFEGFLNENPDIVAQVETAVEEEELPPDPGLLVRRNAYGPGTHSVKFANGTSLGNFIRDQGMTGAQVRELLAGKLDDDLIEWFASQREKGITADAEIAANPVVAAFQEEEDRARAAKAENQKAFLDAYRKKTKEKA